MPTSTPIFPQTIVNPAMMLNDTNGNSILPFWQGSTNGDKLESLSMCSTDTNANVVKVYMGVGGINYPIGTVNVPALAGTDAGITPAVNALGNGAMMPWVRNDSNGRSYLYIANGSLLEFQNSAVISAGKRISIVGQLGSF